MKANNVIAPYKTTMLPDLSQPDMATPQSPSGRSGTMRSLITKATPKAAPSKPALAEGAASHVPGRTVVLFALQHAAAASLVPLAQQLWRIQRQCAAGAHSTHEVSALSSILDSRREGPFNMGLVSSFREKALLPAGPVAVYAERIFPLVTCPVARHGNRLRSLFYASRYKLRDGQVSFFIITRTPLMCNFCVHHLVQ